MSGQRSFAQQLDEALGLVFDPPEPQAPCAPPAGPQLGQPSTSPCASPAHWSSSEVSCALHASPGPYDPHAAESSPAGPYSPVLPETDAATSDPPGPVAAAPQGLLLPDPQPPHDPQQQGPAKRARSSPPDTPTPSPLASLPREVLLRVLYFVAAQDLASLARVSRLIQQFSNEPVLWRRLYCARWGNRRLPRVHTGWKARYRDRDAAETAELLGAAPEGLAGVWRDLAAARRQTALGRAQVDDLFLVPDEVGERVTAWRQAHGFEPGGPQTSTPPAAAPAAGRGGGNGSGNSSSSSRLRAGAGPSRDGQPSPGSRLQPGPFSTSAAAAGGGVDGRSSSANRLAADDRRQAMQGHGTAHSSGRQEDAGHIEQQEQQGRQQQQQQGRTPPGAAVAAGGQAVSPGGALLGSSCYSYADRQQGGGQQPSPFRPPRPPHQQQQQQQQQQQVGSSGSVPAAGSSSRVAPVNHPQPSHSSGRQGPAGHNVRAIPSGGNSSSSSRSSPGQRAFSSPQQQQQQRQRHTARRSSFERVAANVWCCTVTGRVHVCDEACSEKVVDRSTGLLVCPISGATSDRMMSSAEEALEEGLAARGAEEGGGGAAEDDFGGRLARAYTAGYYADDEKDLLRTCGVRLRR